MNGMGTEFVQRSLAALGSELESRGFHGPITICLAGGAAGLLGGWLRASRVTADCDVMRLDPEEAWEGIGAAAGAVAGRLGLPATWINRECRIHEWCVPLGWASRCEPVGRFGPLEVRRMARVDLIACKIVSAPRRPQDLEDLRDLAPTAAELEAAQRHLERLERESLAGEPFNDQWRIVRLLRGGV
jgi:hypothetical protein